MKIGIDLGGSHIAIGVINENNKIVERFEKSFTKNEKEKIIATLEIYLKEILSKIKAKYDVEMIGIAVPGATKDGIILKTVNIGINNYNIESLIKSIINVPVIVKNDGKCATIAEYDYLVRNSLITKQANMLFLTIGTGIGGGVIYNGKILQGNIFDGYEMGHIVIKAGGRVCKCGNRGCFERYGSIVEHKRKLEHRLNIKEQITGDELRKIMMDNQEKIIDIEEKYLSDLALGISNLINIFEPDLIVLGGGFVHYSHLYLKTLKNILLNSNLLFNKRNDICIRCAELGNDAGIIGAAILHTLN